MGQTTTWKYIGYCFDGARFEIAGLNVWQHEWVATSIPHAHVRDPFYGSPFEFPVYAIEAGAKRVLFAAGEFSNCVWGFYVPEQTESPTNPGHTDGETP